MGLCNSKSDTADHKVSVAPTSKPSPSPPPKAVPPLASSTPSKHSHPPPPSSYSQKSPSEASVPTSQTSAALEELQSNFSTSAMLSARFQSQGSCVVTSTDEMGAPSVMSGRTAGGLTAEITSLNSTHQDSIENPTHRRIASYRSDDTGRAVWPRPSHARRETDGPGNTAEDAGAEHENAEQEELPGVVPMEVGVVKGGSQMKNVPGDYQSVKSNMADYRLNIRGDEEGVSVVGEAEEEDEEDETKQDKNGVVEGEKIIEGTQDEPQEKAELVTGES
ncbi:hypothetical protein HDV05_008105 [Chytridiales sp. JEL 0842]|nr:hypothetical protein HDV05_008105 [Chytridiales sp. JEL 0842]